jgi:uncharacterized membrane protein
MKKLSWTRTLKFLHIVGSTGYCAALLSLLVLHVSLPDPAELEQFSALRIVMGNIAAWLLLPSTGLVMVSGLIAMGFNESYKIAGWAWAKLATSVLVLEATLVYVQAPMERASASAQLALAGEADPISLVGSLASEWYSFWIVLGVAAINIVLGVFRPRFSRKRNSEVRL